MSLHATENLLVALIPQLFIKVDISLLDQLISSANFFLTFGHLIINRIRRYGTNLNR